MREVSSLRKREQFVRGVFIDCLQLGHSGLRARLLEMQSWQKSLEQWGHIVGCPALQ